MFKIPSLYYLCIWQITVYIFSVNTMQLLESVLLMQNTWLKHYFWCAGLPLKEVLQSFTVAYLCDDDCNVVLKGHLINEKLFASLKFCVITIHIPFYYLLSRTQTHHTLKYFFTVRLTLTSHVWGDQVALLGAHRSSWV